MKAQRLIFGALLAGLLLGCAKDQPAQDPPARAQFRDLGLTARDFGWDVTAPEAVGVSSKGLISALDFMAGNHLNVHGILVVKNGTVVLDVSVYPYLSYTRHDIASITKSITGTLTGTALAASGITIDTPVVNLFGGRVIANHEPWKAQMRIRDLLTMQSGLDCSSDLTLLEMLKSDDWVQFTLDLPMNSAPGDRFQYCSCNSYLLSAIVHQITGSKASEFARQTLWAPLGITDVVWPLDFRGIENRGWGDLQMSLYDLAKIGELYAGSGSWGGLQLIPRAWFEAAVTSSVEFEDGGLRTGYGFQWWTFKGGYWGIGRGGQRLAVFPEDDLIIAILSSVGEKDEPRLDSLLFDHLRAAVNEGIPPDPESAALLLRKVQLLREPTPGKRVAVRRSPLSTVISGKPYQLAENLLGLRLFTLRFPEDKRDTAWVTIELPGNESMKLTAGLDGVPRFSPGRNGVLGSATGSWVDDHTFEATLDELGNINRWEIRARFSEEGGKVALTIVEKTGLPPFSVQGVAD